MCVMSFRWNAIVLDGHDIGEIVKAFHNAEQTKGKPTMLLAKTYKGKGITGIEDQMNWHGKALGDKTAAAVAEIEKEMSDKRISGKGVNERTVISDAQPVDNKPITLAEPPSYAAGVKVDIFLVIKFHLILI